jgi:hypothetical protein
VLLHVRLDDCPRKDGGRAEARPFGYKKNAGNTHGVPGV